ncbi:RhuM family protein [Corynebacterium sp. sy039]|uniref:RhuM family protein n=1 Tax=Corynebacterium sp. sy039 TaxID=2599641 RepID=UPI00352F96E0
MDDTKRNSRTIQRLTIKRQRTHKTIFNSDELTRKEVVRKFRKWATEVLIKGFALNDNKLKDPRGINYFDQLLERIRDIRSAEARLYLELRNIIDLLMITIWNLPTPTNYLPLSKTNFTTQSQGSLHLKSSLLAATQKTII